MTLSASFSRIGRAAVCGLLLLVNCAPASEGDSLEYQKKAERVCSLARFVEWPARRFQQADSPFVIGVAGSDAISGYLRETLQDRRIKGHPVVVKRMLLKEEYSACHILFVSRSEKDRLDQVLRAVRREGVLTVGESENFLGHGGVMALLMVGDTIRLQVSNEAATREKLVVSSKLLQLALPPNFDLATRPPDTDR